MKCFEFRILYSSYCRRRQRGTFFSQEENAYLSSSVYDLSGVVLSIVLDNPAEGILNCGVITFHEMMLDKADGERGFACNPALDDKIRLKVGQGKARTDGAATDNRDLSLFRGGRHLGSGTASTARKIIKLKSKFGDRE